MRINPSLSFTTPSTYPHRKNVLRRDRFPFRIFEHAGHRIHHQCDRPRAPCAR